SQFDVSNPDNAIVNGTARITELSSQGLNVNSIQGGTVDGNTGRDAGVEDKWDLAGVSDPGNGDCTLDGVYEPCANLSHLIGYEGNGGVVQCPDNDCGPRRATYTDPRGGEHDFLTSGFAAYADGTSGFGIPEGIRQMRDNYNWAAAVIADGGFSMLFSDD